jgi:type VII secretion integral membrane protein EccD
VSSVVEGRAGASVAESSEVCRINVIGPRGRADLAVPVQIPVANLLPVLLRYLGETPGPGEEPVTWVLQRLGGAPFDPDATPETLDWRDGEELHLRQATDALPELKFDDAAEGLVMYVNRRPGRWRAEFNRWLFLGFSIAALLLVAWIVLHPAADAAYLMLGATGLAALVLLTGSIVAAGGPTADRVLVVLLGLGGCGFAALAGAVAATGVAGAVALEPYAILIGAIAVLFAGAVLLLARTLSAPALPFAPIGTVIAIGLVAVVGEWLYLGVQLSPAQAAGVLSAVLVVALSVWPRVAIRMARVRGPQLPWNADDLQVDTDPILAKEMAERTAFADDSVTAAAVAAAAAIVAALPFLVDQGTVEIVLSATVATAVLLRARAFRNAWQRVPLSAAGGIGLAMVVASLMASLDTLGQALGLVVLAGVTVALLQAMMRPPVRRMLPIWGHVANGLETISAVAVIPLLLQLFGVYALVAGILG